MTMRVRPTVYFLPVLNQQQTVTLYVIYVFVCFYQTVWNHRFLKGQPGAPGPRGPPGAFGEQGSVTTNLKGRKQHEGSYFLNVYSLFMILIMVPLNNKTAVKTGCDSNIKLKNFVCGTQM